MNAAEYVLYGHLLRAFLQARRGLEPWPWILCPVGGADLGWGMAIMCGHFFENFCTDLRPVTSWAAPSILETSSCSKGCPSKPCGLVEKAKMRNYIWFHNCVTCWLWLWSRKVQATLFLLVKPMNDDTYPKTDLCGFRVDLRPQVEVREE